MMKNQIAIYLRLSLEDVDKRTNAVKMTATASLQRLLYQPSSDQTPMLCDLPRIEFPAMTDFPAPILTVLLIFSG